MINVTRKDYALTVAGHAGFAAKGEDIVCAAASMLFYTLTNTLMRMGIMLSTNEDAGHAITAEAHPPAQFTFDADVVFDTICTGYMLLADAHPEHVTFTDES